MYYSNLLINSGLLQHTLVEPNCIADISVTLPFKLWVRLHFTRSKATSGDCPITGNNHYTKCGLCRVLTICFAMLPRAKVVRFKRFHLRQLFAFRGG